MNVRLDYDLHLYDCVYVCFVFLVISLLLINYSLMCGLFIESFSWNVISVVLMSRSYEFMFPGH